MSKPQRLKDSTQQGLVNIMWSFATLRYYPAKYFHAVLPHLARLLPGLRDQELANCLWAFGRLAHHPGRLMPALCEAVDHQVPFAVRGANTITHLEQPPKIVDQNEHALVLSCALQLMVSLLIRTSMGSGSCFTLCSARDAVLHFWGSVSDVPWYRSATTRTSPCKPPPTACGPWLCWGQRTTARPCAWCSTCTAMKTPTCWTPTCTRPSRYAAVDNVPIRMVTLWVMARCCCDKTFRCNAHFSVCSLNCSASNLAVELDRSHHTLHVTIDFVLGIQPCASMTLLCQYGQANPKCM